MATFAGWAVSRTRDIGRILYPFRANVKQGVPCGGTRTAGANPGRGMAKPLPASIGAAVRARDALRAKERDLERARNRFLEAVAKAADEHSIAAVARELKVTRQRVQQLVAAAKARKP